MYIFIRVCRKISDWILEKAYARIQSVIQGSILMRQFLCLHQKQVAFPLRALTHVTGVNPIATRLLNWLSCRCSFLGISWDSREFDTMLKGLTNRWEKRISDFTCFRLLLTLLFTTIVAYRVVKTLSLKVVSFWLGNWSSMEQVGQLGTRDLLARMARSRVAVVEEE